MTTLSVLITLADILSVLDEDADDAGQRLSFFLPCFVSRNICPSTYNGLDSRIRDVVLCIDKGRAKDVCW